jgi:PEP-CTERM motif
LLQAQHAEIKQRLEMNGVAIFNTTFAASATAPTLETFNWAGINEVDVSTAGGTPHAGYSGSGTQVAMDNLTITTAPEPSTLSIIGAGLAGLGLARRRRKVA